MTFEWVPRKARANLKKHHVDFDEAASVFLDPLATTYPDPADSSEEHREITVGYMARMKPPSSWISATSSSMGLAKSSSQASR